MIVDDSTLERPRSKMVELLARVYDHAEHKYLKGFRFLSVCWSDGASFLPLDFALLSSAKKKNRLQEVTKKLDKRSCGYKRRIEAQSKATDLLEPMIKRILRSKLRRHLRCVPGNACLWFDGRLFLTPRRTFRHHLRSDVRTGGHDALWNSELPVTK